MIFVTGGMKTVDLMKAGFVMKVIGIIVIFGASLLLISPVFDIHEMIPMTNNTLIANATIG
jgi:hypothetical protein